MRKKLLLADDSITIQKVVELTFPSDEFEVVTAGNGRIAVDKAATFLPDIVLCDVIMPQLDGYQVCETLRATEALKDVPILLLNGAFEPYDSERAKAVGAIGNVSKPFDPPALVARVKEILRERAAAAAPIAAPAIEELPAAAALDDPRTVDMGIPAHTVPHDFTYDETETHPVSTVEVPMGVRELAARSLSLDAPVFASPEPDVLTSEADPANFSETLHGPLDEEIQAPVEVAPPVESVEEIEAIDAPEEFLAKTEPAVEELAEEPSVISTGEVQAPEPMDVEPAASSAPVSEFSGEHEFDPAALDAAAAVHVPDPDSEPEAPIALAAPAPAPMPEPLPEPEIEPEPEPAPFAESAAPGIPEHEPDVLPAPVAFDEPEHEITPEPPLPMEAAPPAASAPEPEPEPEPEPAPPAIALPAPAAVAAVAAVAVAAAPMAPAPASETAVPSAEVAVPVDMVQQIAQRVISQVSERVIREIAWDVIPGLTEKLIKAEMERIRARAESERD